MPVRSTLTMLLLVLSVALIDAPVLAAPCWQPPVRGTIVDRFREPPCPYCAGNRGIEYRVASSSEVRAVQAGRVTFSGDVAGTIYVVVEHANGWKVTYGNLSAAEVRRGRTVVRGAVLGQTTGTFFFGLRVLGEYRDPERYFGRMVGTPRLVPVDGTRRRPAPAPRLTCAD